MLNLRLSGGEERDAENRDNAEIPDAPSTQQTAMKGAQIQVHRQPTPLPALVRDGSKERSPLL